MTQQEMHARMANPAFFFENRLPPHSDHTLYPTAAAALAGGETPLRRSLNGMWKFLHAPNPAACPQGFEQPDFRCAGWDDIRVPGHMELAGYGKPQYVDSRYPWDGVETVTPHDIPVDFNPTGCYVKLFRLPAGWQGGDVHVTFDGVETCFFLWCNGVYIGYSEDSYTPASFDLSAALRPGENKLAVQVSRFCSGAWLEDQDYWRFSGIFRGVFLSLVPKAHIRDVKLTAGLDDGYSTGLLDVSLEVPAGADVAWRLLSPAGEPVCAGSGSAFSAQVPQVLPWSGEAPHLYTLVLAVRDETGAECCATACRVGFRRVEILHSVLHLNGKRLIFRGVNRHEFSCDKGRAIGREEMLHDIRFLKQNNFNAVRTSHYPNQTLWYELCDESGIYVIDEVNLETHGTWQAGNDDYILPGDKPEWKAAVLDRAAAMLQRDKNHASVLIWSCGNESWGGGNLYAVSQYLREADPTRPIHYEAVCHDRRYPDTTDFESRMYTTPAQAAEYLADNPAKPYLLCEYAHAMGNACGGLHEYVALEDAYPAYAGGFIWDFADQTLRYTNPMGEEDLAIGGDFGDRPTDNCFCTNGLLYGDRTPSPKLAEVKQLYSPFRIEPDRQGAHVRSNLLFTDGAQYRLEWALLRDGAPCRGGTRAFGQAPGTTQYYPLLEEAPAAPGEYVLEARLVLAAPAPYADAGHEVCFGQFVYEVAAAERAQGTAPDGAGAVDRAGQPPAADAPLQIAEGFTAIAARTPGFAVQFDKTAGRIGSLRVDGLELTQSPLQTLLPNFWRAPTDSDVGNGHPNRCAVWKTASLYAKVLETKHEARANSLFVATTYALPGGGTCTMEYDVQPGCIWVTETYHAAPNLPEMPCFGAVISLPRDVRHVRYYGLGPGENYADRRCGARLGLFETTAAAEMARYLIPQECGNHTGVRCVQLTDGFGRGLRVSAAQPFEFSALPYTCHELENAYHRYELPPVTKTVLRVGSQMGIGGDNAWGARVHDAYLLPSDQDRTFRFCLQPVTR